MDWLLTLDNSGNGQVKICKLTDFPFSQVKPRSRSKLIYKEISLFFKGISNFRDTEFSNLQKYFLIGKILAPKRILELLKHCKEYIQKILNDEMDENLIMFFVDNPVANDRDFFRYS